MVSKSLKVVLITPGQPSTNPRLVKEADALHNEGFEVTVIYQYRNQWATETDKDLLSNRKWKAIRVGGSPTDERWRYIFTKIIYKVIKLLSKIKKLKSITAPMATSWIAWWLTRAALQHKADMYIAHNLAALPAAVKGAKKHKGKCGFDAEDFHRYETTNDKETGDVFIKAYIEDKYIPQADQTTASSPQISLNYKALYPEINPIVILNVFPASFIKYPANEKKIDESLKLFWISQTIGDNRGLKDIVEALNILNDQRIELHLLGDKNHNDPFVKWLDNANLNLIYHAPITLDNLTEFSSQFDIGLALEPGFCANNNFALSNKIFTYLQSGLAIVASDTPAQKDFMLTYPESGLIYKIGDSMSLAAILNNYLKNPTELIKAKQASLHFAHEQLNWELESKKFIDLIGQTLGV